MWRNLRNNPKWKKPDTKDHRVYDSIYMKTPRKGKSRESSERRPVVASGWWKNEEWGFPSCCCCCLAAKSCSALLDFMDCDPPGSSVQGISQTRMLEKIAISFSRGPSRPRDQTCVSCTGRKVLFYWATFLCGHFCVKHPGLDSGGGDTHWESSKWLKCSL